MFHTYYAHSLEDLAHHFCDIDIYDRSNHLEPIWVIVQNNEIKEWLSLHYAARKGIAGNFKFIFPSEFLWALYRLKKKDVPKVLPGDLNAMQWALFDLFSKNKELLGSIPVYDPEKDGISKRFQLCSQLADVFDQYQVYRPEMLQGWLNGKSSTKNKDEKWQAFIWKKLNRYWNHYEDTEGIPSRPQAHEELVEWLDEGESSILTHIPEDLVVFGLSQINAPFAQIMSKYGRHKNVHFFHRKLDVSGEEETIRQLLSMWKEPADKEVELLEHTIQDQEIDPKYSSVDELYNTTMPSIHVHSCHNNRREVEVLKDQILGYLEENSEAEAKDILILLPDAEEYAPIIESVFEGKNKEPKLPVSRIYPNLQTASHTLSLLLDILGSSFKPSTVMEILNMEPVKQKFSINEEEIDTIEGWIQQNKIHRGIGESYNAPFSWKKGINQLMAGFLMETEDLEVYKGLVPYDGIYSSEEVQLAARFSALIHSLINFAEETERSKTIADWLNFTELITKELITSESGDEPDGKIFNILSRLKDQVAYTKGQHKVPYSLMKNWLKSQINNQDSASGRFGHGITVSSYVPYRSVPFTFIAMLGLNEGVFPRKAIRPEFDLIYSDARPGDRIQKNDDTYLFLETLFSAQELFHISYHGQDQQSDNIMLPSMPVQQLMDILDESKISSIKHKLHPFDKRYFKPDKDSSSYSKEDLELAKNVNDQAKIQATFIDAKFDNLMEEKADQILLEDLINFFTDPSKYILSNKLNIATANYYTDMADRESFDLSSLESFQLDGFIYEKLKSGYTDKEIYRYAKTLGLVPDKLKGEKVFHSALNEAAGLQQEVEKVSSTQEQEVEVETEVFGVTIKGKIRGIYGDTFVSSRAGKRKPKYEIGHWLTHLILLKCEIPISRSIYISKEKTEIDILEIDSKAISPEILNSYLDWFFGAYAVIDKLAFFPETSKAYTEEWLKKRDKEKALAKAIKTWEPKPNYTFVESNEFSNQVVWRNRDPFSSNVFHENALKFWVPFIEAIEGSNNGK